MHLKCYWHLQINKKLLMLVSFEDINKEDSHDPDSRQCEHRQTDGQQEPQRHFYSPARVSLNHFFKSNSTPISTHLHSAQNIPELPKDRHMTAGAELLKCFSVSLWSGSWVWLRRETHVRPDLMLLLLLFIIIIFISQSDFSFSSSHVINSLGLHIWKKHQQLQLDKITYFWSPAPFRCSTVSVQQGAEDSLCHISAAEMFLFIFERTSMFIQQRRILNFK